MHALCSHFNQVQLFVTLWTIVCQSPLSMGFSRQEYWSGLPFPPLGNLPNPGIEPTSPTSPALTGRFFTTEIPRKPGEMVQFSSVQSLSRVRLLRPPWTITCQSPLSMGFSRQEYWSGLPFPSPGIFPIQGLNPRI